MSFVAECEQCGVIERGEFEDEDTAEYVADALAAAGEEVAEGAD